jgi:hypothetical protein
VEQLIRAQDGEHRWVNLDGYFSWARQTDDNDDANRISRRQVIASCGGFLVKRDEAQSFVDWAKSVDVNQIRMPDPPSLYELFAGEHPWAPAAVHYAQPYFGDDDWSQPEDCPVRVRVSTIHYMREGVGFDCSVDDSLTLRMPCKELITGLGLRWSGIAADFVASNEIIAFDPTAHDRGASSLLVREDALKEFLAREGLTMCWLVFGEKRFLSDDGQYRSRLEFGGACLLNDTGVVGHIDAAVRDSNGVKAAATRLVVGTTSAMK